MSSKLIMSSSSILLAAIGILALFLPEEIMTFLNASDVGNSPLIVTMLGSVYLGFAFLNWNSRSIIIGGIYAKPLSLGNFAHFTISFISLIKIALPSTSILLWILAVLYGILALGFGKITFSNVKS